MAAAWRRCLKSRYTGVAVTRTSEEEAPGARGRDEAADRRGRSRAAHEPRAAPRTSIAGVAREAGVQRQHRVRPLSRRAVPLPRLRRALGSPAPASRTRLVEPRREPAPAAASALCARSTAGTRTSSPTSRCSSATPRALPRSRRRREEWAGGPAIAADALAAALGGSRAVRAAVGPALAFETWRSLVRHEGRTADARGARDAELRRGRVDLRWARGRGARRPSPESS